MQGNCPKKRVKQINSINVRNRYIQTTRFNNCGDSSVGRASDWRSEGQVFDPPSPHSVLLFFFHTNHSFGVFQNHKLHHLFNRFITFQSTVLPQNATPSATCSIDTISFMWWSKKIRKFLLWNCARTQLFRFDFELKSKFLIKSYPNQAIRFCFSLFGFWST